MKKLTRFILYALVVLAIAIIAGEFAVDSFAWTLGLGIVEGGWLALCVGKGWL